MLRSIGRRTYQILCRWSGMRQYCRICISGQNSGRERWHSKSALPSSVGSTLAWVGLSAGMASVPNSGSRDVTVSVT